MNQKEAERNIVLFKIFQVFHEPLFWGPVLIYYMMHVGKMALADIYIMEAVVLVISIVLEIPTGALADMIGRRKTMLIGALFLLGDIAILGIASNPLMVWISDIVWALGFAFMSGADTSFLYDTLKSLGRGNEYKGIIGRSTCYRLVLIAVCSLFAGYIAEINIRLPLILCLPSMILMVVIVYLFKEPESGNGYKFRKQLTLMRDGILHAIFTPRLLWIVVFSAFIAAISKAWFFTYNPYFEKVEISLQYYGYIFFLLNIIAAIFSYNAEKMNAKFSNSQSVAGMVVFLGFPILAMGVFLSQWAISMIFIQNIVRGYFRPFIDHMMHDFIDSEKRATVASVKAATAEGAEVVALGIFSVLLKNYTLDASLIMLGGFTLIAGVVLIAHYKKVF